MGIHTPISGAALQPQTVDEVAEGEVRLAGWIEENGLQRPEYDFAGRILDHFSVRISPPLLGLGLLEAIPEEDILALADPEDTDGDGISGRLHLVRDAESGELRLGRFGWKAGQPTVRQQTAAALRTDMGVLTSVFSETGLWRGTGWLRNAASRARGRGPR